MSTFGTLFRVTTFGESHCKGVGCVTRHSFCVSCASHIDFARNTAIGPGSKHFAAVLDLAASETLP